MKRAIISLLQLLIIIFGIVVLSILIRIPLTEGRAINLDLYHIYTDPFILFGYVASIPFFIALFQGFKLLGYYGKNKIFSLIAVRELKIIKFCSILFSIFILAAGLFIILFHNIKDDPAGFISLCFLITFFSILIAITASLFEKKIKKAIDNKKEK
jgi:hypothetical protein